MSGLLALLDDVAAIAKIAAASVDDIAAAAMKAGAKAAGVVIDDAAVTPKYVHGFSPARELPIIWRIAKGSLWNKLAILLPALLLLNYAAPIVITPLLMMGGAYLCFEGAEKLLHAFAQPEHAPITGDHPSDDAAHLEAEKVAGAIKTDFILSAEIMTIALATIPDGALWLEAVTLAIVGTLVTIAVYGAVAVIVKMDDIGLHLAATHKAKTARAFGRGLVLAMPKLMVFLSTIGTAAMLWVGGNIVVHGLDVTHLWSWPYDAIHHMAQAAAAAVPAAAGFVGWAVTAFFDGIVGVILGAALVSLVNRAIAPLWHMRRPR